MELVNYLPPEVLPNIFKFLLLEDRKNVRLTCQLWNDACNRSEITKYDKFSFRPSDIGCLEDVENVKTAISNRKSFPPEFEFRWLDLDILPPILWERCGTYIKSLFITDPLNFTSENMKDIIVHCPRLTSFYVWSDKDYILIDSVFCNKVIDDLIDLKVIRESLYSFMFYTSSTAIPDDETFRRIFQIYPNIGYLHGNSLSSQLAQSILGEKFTSPSSVKETFQITLRRPDVWMVPLPKSSKLKFYFFSVHLDFRGDLKVKSVKDFVRRHPELKKVKLTFSGNYKEEELKSLLSEIIQRASKLTSLKLNPVNSGITLDHTEFENFLRAIPSLYYLRLSSFSVENVNADDLLRLELNYPRLTELELSGCAEEFYMPILKRCVNLTYLSLTRSRINGEVLWEIFDHHTQLKTLRISGFQDETLAQTNVDLPENDRIPPCLHRLWGLERLVFLVGAFVRFNINGFLYSFPELLAELELSSLRFFHFEFIECNSDWKLHELLELMTVKAPFVRTIHIFIQNVEMPWRPEDCFIPLKKFKKLRTLVFPLLQEGYPMNEVSLTSETSILKDLFIECPLLRRVSIESLGVFFYNRFSEKILFMNDR